jgi:death-on-curing protein
MAFKWLTPEIVKGLHLQSIAAAGGSAGIRDEGLLQSAVDRPRNLHVYGDAPTVHSLAAAYGFGIVRNHPFIDGNKRAGILATAVFLDVNGYAFRPNEAEAVKIVLALAAREIDEAVFADWISDFTIRKT